MKQINSYIIIAMHMVHNCMFITPLHVFKNLEVGRLQRGKRNETQRPVAGDRVDHTPNQYPV